MQFALILPCTRALTCGRTGNLATLVQVDPATFGRNLYLIIGGLIFLFLVFTCLLALVIGVRTILFLVARRRARIEHIRQTRRADGKMYPPAIEGVCEVCKRGGREIYFPQGGVAMCSSCYEQWWRLQDSQSPPRTPSPLSIFRGANRRNAVPMTQIHSVL